jgi:hypothetical protein
MHAHPAMRSSARNEKSLHYLFLVKLAPIGVALTTALPRVLRHGLLRNAGSQQQ